jgi:pyridoxamine 5'-phosphate oxidase
MSKLEVPRLDYSGRPLEDAAMAADPLDQFHAWFDEAKARGIEMPEAMALATATATGAPSVRMVLLKGADARGFVWYTNHESRKGEELRQNRRAALLFYWQVLHRQVRVEGDVEVVDAAESDAYFASRPRAANLSAMASPQSRTVASRAALVEAVDRMEEAFHGLVLERPAHWAGFRLVPRSYEFWQGQQDRLHDRIRYLPTADGGWSRARLAP